MKTVSVYVSFSPIPKATAVVYFKNRVTFIHVWMQMTSLTCGKYRKVTRAPDIQMLQIAVVGDEREPGLRLRWKGRTRKRKAKERGQEALLNWVLCKGNISLPVLTLLPPQKPGSYYFLWHPTEHLVKQQYPFLFLAASRFFKTHV